MMQVLLGIFKGYARPQQIIVFCVVFYAVMTPLHYWVQDDFSDLGIVTMALDWTIGTLLAYGGWRTFRNSMYAEDPLRWLALLVSSCGSFVYLLVKHGN